MAASRTAVSALREPAVDFVNVSIFSPVDIDRLREFQIGVVDAIATRREAVDKWAAYLVDIVR